MRYTSLLRSTVFRRTLLVVLLLTGAAAAVIAVVGWQSNAIMTRATERAIERDAAELRAELVARGIEGLAAAVADRSRPGGPGIYFLADAEGGRRAGNLARMPAWQAGTGRGVFRYERVEAGARQERTGAGVLVEIDGRPRLVVGRDVEEQRALLQAIYRSIGLGILILALVGLAGSYLISRHVLARIDAMSRASADIMAGNLSGRIPVDGSRDELDRLAVELNRMLTRIEALMEGLREVSDNIAHDLKTPLNRLRNRAEAALAGNGGAAIWRQGLERVIDEADELIKTFNALLLIARLEAGTGPDDFELVDAAALARDVAELYEPVAESEGFRLEWTADVVLPVRANRQLVGQALSNLIDNALKYGAGGIEHLITVRAERAADQARLIVADRGIGIPPDQRERALRRFVRLEQSRSQPGTGLGLSLVAAVARIHDGSVRLEDNGPGLRVVLELPLASEHDRVASYRATVPRPETLRG